ncbi:heavy metal sensor histidine kinase [Rouxiella chamberiensis]|uniref:Sensor protein n=1 Tax=Rouxiella chamberiensis TaxID=1513468 RepID=A0ABY7HPN2_9GAMM|nr:heavy metal sensor histidine kinase [Rouxiella chamberiensis]WAT01339.1 heavy metal sensor histidine kinase [Rouxiella chamberiensis]
MRSLSIFVDPRRLSLTTRLSLIFALLTFVVITLAGFTLYRTLETQISLRDDGALLTRVEQIRTLLRDEDVINLIHDKPQLFANMLGNHEALLVLRFPGQPPLIEVNPGHSPVPNITPVSAEAKLTLAAVQHGKARDDTPFISVSAAAKTSDSPHPLEIISGRLMTERTHILAIYREQIILLALAAAAMTALLAYLIARRGLSPLRHLAGQTASIGIKNLSVRIDNRQAPRELSALIDSFNQMLDRLEISFTQLSQVSADMAHDLRTPIGNLLGQTEVALSQRRSVDYYEKLLGSNFEELLRLSKMTDNMLFLARAEHAFHAIERVSLDIADEFYRMSEYFEGPADERGLFFILRGEGRVWADPELLRRALANLIANALRYADAGSEIVLESEPQKEGVKISVVNRGATIDAHHLARLFDRFYRADPSRNTAAQSSGLGLAIVRSIVQLHHGQCHVTSENGETRFSLIFPTSEPANIRQAD